MQIEYIAFGESALRCRQVLCHVAQQCVVAALLVSYLENRNAVFSAQIELAHALACYAASFAYAECADIVRDVIFIGETVERLAVVVARVTLFLSEEYAAQREHDQHAYGKAYQAEREEGEELESFVTVLAQCLVDDEVWRCTDKCHHAAHAAGEGKWHEQLRGVCPALRCHRDDDGHHECHSACVADEGTDGGGDKHHKQEHQRVAAVGYGKNALAHKFCQSGL